MKIGDTYIVTIDDEDSEGNGITRIDNFVTFIPYALKSEKIEIKIVDIRKRFAIGQIDKIIQKSDKRIEPKCPYYNKCGACSFLHTSFEYEKETKLNYINKLFNKNIKEILTNNEYNYRNKASFHIVNGKIGYYSENTHDLVEIDNCLLLDIRINDLVKYFKSSNLSFIEEIIIRCTFNEVMVQIKGNEKYDFSNLVNNNKIDSLYINDKLVYGHEYITEEINNIKYAIYPDAFFQINTSNMIIMYDLIKEYAQTGNNLLDLYCGTGSIGIYLSNNFKSITGIEINKSSILCANINKNINNLNNIKFILGDSKIASKSDYDVIVVDPPRSGLSNTVINYLNKSNAKRIIYVSCNPKTLKRDLDLINNYNLKEMKVINMFNKTKHIECVCILNLR